jgi:hypothetical protein
MTILKIKQLYTLTHNIHKFMHYQFNDVSP